MSETDSASGKFVSIPLKDCISELQRLHRNSSRYLESVPCIRSVLANGKRSGRGDADTDVSLRRKSSRGQNLILKNTTKLFQSYKTKCAELSRQIEERKCKRAKEAGNGDKRLALPDTSFLNAYPPRVIIKACAALNYLDVNGAWADLYSASRESFLLARLGVLNLFPFATQFCYDALNMLLRFRAAELTNFREKRQGKLYSVDYICWISTVDGSEVISAVQIAIRPYNEDYFQMTGYPLPHLLTDGTVNRPAVCEPLIGVPSDVTEHQKLRSAISAAGLDGPCSPCSLDSDVSPDREPELKYWRASQCEPFQPNGKSVEACGCAPPPATAMSSATAAIQAAAPLSTSVPSSVFSTPSSLEMRSLASIVSSVDSITPVQLPAVVERAVGHPGVAHAQRVSFDTPVKFEWEPIMPSNYQTAMSAAGVTGASTVSAGSIPYTENGIPAHASVIPTLESSVVKMEPCFSDVFSDSHAVLGSFDNSSWSSITAAAALPSIVNMHSQTSYAPHVEGCVANSISDFTAPFSTTPAIFSYSTAAVPASAELPRKQMVSPRHTISPRQNRQPPLHESCAAFDPAPPNQQRQPPQPQQQPSADLSRGYLMHMRASAALLSGVPWGTATTPGTQAPFVHAPTDESVRMQF